MRGLARKLVMLVATLLVLPAVLVVKVAGSNRSFVFFGQLLALVPGLTGSFLRLAYYSRTLERCAGRGEIGFGSYYSHRASSFGYGCYIGAYCIIGMVEMGDHVTIGSQVSLLSGKKQHNFEQIDVPIQEQGGEFNKISIGSNCWIGNGAVVMANLGSQVVVGAGAVVAKDFGDRVVVAGNPARVVKNVGQA
jgi:acetyltransferase-like isoleucine patch superfamily enzyme